MTNEYDMGILNPPNTGDPVEQVWMFVSRDLVGKENVIGSLMGSLGTQPLVTGNWKTLQIFLPFARQIERQMAGTGKTIHLLTFSNRKEVIGWLDGVEQP